MRIIRLILISILVLFIIVTIISLFIPSHVQVSKAVLIHSPKDLVMAQISDPKNWKNWYPGADSSNLFYENGIATGLILNKSKQQYIKITGKKEDEITAAYILVNKKIRTGWQIATTLDSSSVTVQWYMDFHLRWYPWEKFTSFMFERIYNPQLQKGLDNLKTFLEK